MEVPCLIVPVNRKITIKTPVIKLTGSEAFKKPRVKYPRVDRKFPKRIVKKT
jgi:hypothetical protein